LVLILEKYKYFLLIVNALKKGGEIEHAIFCFDQVQFAATKNHPFMAQNADFGPNKNSKRL